MFSTDLSKVQLMGILNLTPDSFSDGGKLDTLSTKQFLETAEQMLIDGATILDLGAEASGPNSVEVSEQEEANRLFAKLESLQPLKTKYNFKISVDTYKASIAKKSLQLGADIINDITALRGDPEMAKTLSQSNCQIILMYSKDNTPRTTKNATTYTDIIQTIIQFFEQQLKICQQNQITLDRIILDPGMGAFLSTIPDYSYQVLERLTEIKNHFKLPILIGTSLKSFHPFPLEQRLIPSIATALLASFNGADIIRVHQVKEHFQALKTFSKQ